MKLHEDLNKMLSERETPMKNYDISSYDLQASFFRTTERMGLKNTIATESEALAKAEEARIQLEKAIDRQYAIIESKLFQNQSINANTRGLLLQQTQRNDAKGMKLF